MIQHCNENMKKRIIRNFAKISLIFLMFLTLSCGYGQCSYKINSEKIRFSCGLYNGIMVEKIIQIENFKNDVPEEYEVEYTASYAADDAKALKDAMQEGMNEIYFNEEKDGYSWFVYGTTTVSKTFPYKFENNQWYLFRNLYKDGVASVKIFVYVDEDSDFNTYRVDKPTNY